MTKAKKRAAARKKSSQRRKGAAKPSHKTIKDATKKATPKAASGTATRPKARPMTKITYEVVQHDGGWAYRVDGVFSEAFPSHDEARSAAEQAASRTNCAGRYNGDFLGR